MKLKFLSLYVLIFCTFTFTNIHAQKYNISVQLLNCKDSTAYLAHYFDGKIFADDTTSLVNGQGSFSKDKVLDQGIYVIYLPSQKYFDLLIGEDQEFSITADPKDFIGSINITGSKESKAFHAFQNFMKSQNVKSKKIQEAFKKSNNEAEKEKFKKEFKNTDVEVRAYISKLASEFPENSFVHKFASFTLSPKIPDFKNEIPANTPDREKVIQKKSYLYNKNHYFDHVNLTDNRYLRTPILKKKLDFFYEKILVQSPDTIVKESVKLIEQARPDSIFFQYLTQYALNYAVKSKVMGMDAAFVKLAKKYYLSGQASWADSTLMANIRERVIKTQFNLIGMESKDLLMQTPEGEFVRLHEVDAPFTVLYFWEPDCGHCKKVTPRLKSEILDQYREKGLKVFAVCTQDQKEMWEDAIHDYDIYDFINCYDPEFQTNFRIYYDVYSTPTMYLLDKDKKIIAKRLDIDNLKVFLDNEMKKN
ncbi:TlpA family protein disulfide reductase [Marinifilum caeruleilacunae]|uniref:Redoxin domain-containing protein n=1 Tax=Marinifilum caeruleilacunae TaxID=2499076 RepID=A0ABX1WXN4_9BACT|nr:TlpA family protein disulfide reductase [Marinifilum caeruleilacunae]NOU60797.1 redoxin domain-containing protein [Marinifilum caeruleilacunae]